MLFFMEIVKKTISLEIMAAQNPRRKNLIQIVSELKEKVKRLPIMMKIDQTRFEKRERAEHLLKLKTTSFFMDVLLTNRSVSKIIEKNPAAVPIPRIKLEMESLSARQENIASIRVRVRR